MIILNDQVLLRINYVCMPKCLTPVHLQLMSSEADMFICKHEPEEMWIKHITWPDDDNVRWEQPYKRPNLNCNSQLACRSLSSMNDLRYIGVCPAVLPIAGWIPTVLKIRYASSHPPHIGSNSSQRHTFGSCCCLMLLLSTPLISDKCKQQILAHNNLIPIHSWAEFQSYGHSSHQSSGIRELVWVNYQQHMRSHTHQTYASLEAYYEHLIVHIRLQMYACIFIFYAIHRLVSNQFSNE